MRQIDLSTWVRHNHFEQFKTWNYPHFNGCANVDMTGFFRAVNHALMDGVHAGRFFAEFQTLLGEPESFMASI